MKVKSKILNKTAQALLSLIDVEIYLDVKPDGKFIAKIDIPIVNLCYFLIIHIRVIKKTIFKGYFTIE